jgi:two-component system, OmpR family, manganese sensing sensor histidine kinase
MAFSVTPFKDLGWRLLATYWVVMAAILGSSALAVYLGFVHVIYSQQDIRLEKLAIAAQPSLKSLQQEGPSTLALSQAPWTILLHRDQQSVAWYDINKNRLAVQGAIVAPLPADLGIERQGWQSPSTRSLFVPVQSANQNNQIAGYILVTESTQPIELMIRQLRLGMAIGALVALGLSSLGSIILAQRTLAPTRRSYEKLKQFTADASHELRSPLTAIKFSLEVIMKHPERIHPKNTRKLAAITSATDQMIQLVEDLLFLARAEVNTKQQKTEVSQISIYKILQGLLTLLEPQALNRQIAFESVLIPDVFVLGDEAKLSRLFSNLLENALQYTPAGGSVKVRIEKSVKSVFISFEDTGIGIAPNQIRSVFRRLWRTDRARSRRDGGVGLGLSIAKAIAQQHNGEIIVTSRVGVGSCFRVRLPLVRTSAEHTETITSPLSHRKTVDQPVRG